ncbi:MAG: Hsp20/alpha crystallin family protein [Armatimonadota bacterium]
MNRFYEDLIRQMEQEFERSDEMLRRFLHSVTSPERFWEPRADVYETREAVKVKVELAGVRADSIHVELSGDGRTLAIRGVREDERTEAVDRILFHQMEIYLGPFERVLPLPPGANVERDQVNAAYRDGFLLITLPKRVDPGPTTTNIPVRG